MTTGYQTMHIFGVYIHAFLDATKLWNVVRVPMSYVWESDKKLTVWPDLKWRTIFKSMSMLEKKMSYTFELLFFIVVFWNLLKA